MPGAVTAIVPAAGRGVRLGSGPKAFVPLCGEPLLRHAVRGLLGSGCVDDVAVAVAASDRDRADESLVGLERRVRFATGGPERTDSVRAALELAADAEFVLVHDAARCLTPVAVIRSVVQALRAGHRAVVPVVPVADTVKQVGADGAVRATIDRSGLRAVQTPQGFAADLLRRAYRQPGAATDDAALVERLGERVCTVPGHPHAFKITTSLDLRLAASVAGGPR